MSWPGTEQHDGEAAMTVRVPARGRKESKRLEQTKERNTERQERAGVVNVTVICTLFLLLSPSAECVNCTGYTEMSGRLSAMEAKVKRDAAAKRRQGIIKDTPY